MTLKKKSRLFDKAKLPRKTNRSKKEKQACQLLTVV